MSSIAFQNWLSSHPVIAPSFVHREGKNCRWVRIHALWNEKIDPSKASPHQYAFTLDKETGSLYIDCRKRKIWVKFAFLSIGHPLFGFFKTIYHLAFPLSLPIEIFKAIQKGINDSLPPKEIGTRVFENIKFSLADSFRTPLYTVALSILSIAALVIGPFAPVKLYDVRTLAAKLEITLHRGNESMVLAPCFQPLSNLMTIALERDYEADDTIYDSTWDPTMKGLSNLARSAIKHRRKDSVLFNDCGMLFPKGKTFISSAIS